MLKRIIIAVCVAALICPAVYAAEPKVWYSMDDEQNVWREEDSGRVKADVDVQYVDGTVFMWFQADSAVWIFNPYNLEHAPVYIPLRKNEDCLDLMMSGDGSVFVLGLTPETIAAYTPSGEPVIRTPGILPVFWKDSYRFAYTSCVKGTRRGRGQNVHTWRGVSVFEVFPEENNGKPGVLVTPVIKATRTADYIASGIDADGNCIVIKREGTSEEELHVPFPAAG